MGTTDRFGFRYPALTEPPHGPQALRFLAEDVEARIARAYPATNSERLALTGLGDGFLVRETDTGRLWIWDGSDWDELALGSGGGGGGGAPGFISVKGMWRATSAQSLSNGVDTVVGFGTTELASAIVTRSSSGPGHKFTLAEDGTYAVNATIRFDDDDDDGRRFIELRNAGQTIRYPGACIGGRVEQEPMTLSFCTVERFAAGTELVVIAAQNTGGTLALDPTGDSITHGFVRLSILKIGS